MWHKKCGVLGWICLLLVIIGGINWGLIGIFGYNVVAHLFGAWPAIERIIYILVGIAAIVMIFLACKCCGRDCHTTKTGKVCCKNCGSCSPCTCGTRLNDKIPPENRPPEDRL